MKNFKCFKLLICLILSFVFTFGNTRFAVASDSYIHGFFDESPLSGRETQSFKIDLAPDCGSMRLIFTVDYETRIDDSGNKVLNSFDAVPHIISVQPENKPWGAFGFKYYIAYSKIDYACDCKSMDIRLIVCYEGTFMFDYKTIDKTFHLII